MAYSLLNKIWESTRLTSSEKANLLRRCYVGQDTEQAIIGIYITNKRLSQDTGLSLSTIERSNRSLEAKGFLVNDRATSKSKNNYSIPKAAFEQSVDNMATQDTETVTMTHTDHHHDGLETVTMTHKQLSNSVLSSKQLLEAKKTVENFVGDGRIYAAYNEKPPLQDEEIWRYKSKLL